MRNDDRGLDRFVTFIDAIVAIAITLLVLPLVDIAAEASDEQSLTDLLSDHSTEIWSFFLSFLVIARLWRSHHSIIRRQAKLDNITATASLMWAMTIVFLPFPTQLISAYGDERQIAVFYGLVLLASTLCLSVLALRISQKPALQSDYEGPTISPIAVVTAWAAVALVIAAVFEDSGFKSMFVLLLGFPTSWLLERRATSTAKSSAPASP